MGIRFYCPQGHKLNVKEFQAGRRAICPFCGAKVQVPTESTRPSSKQEKTLQESGSIPISSDERPGTTISVQPIPLPARPSEATVPGPTIATGSIESDPTIAPGMPAQDPPIVSGPGWEPPAVASPRQQSPAVATTVSAVAAAPTPQAAPPLPAAAPPAASSPADPLAQAGDVVWYVRHSTGGQFGPATGEVLRTWLAEGRVSADSLVWREGWRDWVEAGEVFPQLRAEAMMALPGPAGPAAEGFVPPVTAGSYHHPPRHRTTNNQTAIVIALLIAAVVVLGVLFVLTLAGLI